MKIPHVGKKRKVAWAPMISEKGKEKEDEERIKKMKEKMDEVQ